jgi:hypothetical protein
VLLAFLKFAVNPPGFPRELLMLEFVLESSATNPTVQSKVVSPVSKLDQGRRCLPIKHSLFRDCRNVRFRPKRSFELA